MFKLSKLQIIFIVAISFFSQSLYSLSNLTRNDYLPLYTTMQPHEYLHTQTKAILLDREPEDSDWLDVFSLYLTPFGQNANCGRNFDNKDDGNDDPIYDDLGSLNAKWSLVGLLTGDIPTDQTLTPTLAYAKNNLFGLVTSDVLDDSRVIDSDEKLGFYYFPAEYKKRGFRIQLSVGIFEDLGFMLQAGVADINFNVTNFSTDNATASEPTCLSSTYTNYSVATVNSDLICQFENIASDLELDIKDFHKSGVEDVRLSLFWRRAIEMHENDDWPNFLVIPFLEAGASLAAGKEKAPLKAFGLPFGNNGHNALGAKGGINLDFAETIEIGFELGATYFFENEFCDYPTPTSTLQSGIFPFKTTVKIKPGFNWQFGLKLNAHHFMKRLSFYFQWQIAEHKNDKIKVCNGDTTFKPEALECRSGWKTQVINTALNYDVSPHVSLGFAWQAPISQRNVFRSTSVLFGLNFTF